MSPGARDPKLVRRHLAALDHAVQRLRKHAGRTLDELQRDPDLVWAIERGLHVAVQNCLDVASHLAASAGRDVEHYSDAIEALGESGILPRDFARRFRGIAGFRNVLVHGYLDVDLAKVHELLNERLADFEQFSAHVDRHLASP